jgi:hypothetical protein
MNIQTAQPNLQQVNVGNLERRLSVVGGLFTLVYLLSRRPKIRVGLPLFLEAGYMLYRGITGHCMVYEAIGLDHAADRNHSWRPDQQRTGLVDPVEVASEDSFPASDPPGWVSSGRIE